MKGLKGIPVQSLDNSYIHKDGFIVLCGCYTALKTPGSISQAFNKHFGVPVLGYGGGVSWGLVTGRPHVKGEYASSPGSLLGRLPAAGSDGGRWVR